MLHVPSYRKRLRCLCLGARTCLQPAPGVHCKHLPRLHQSMLLNDVISLHILAAVRNACAEQSRRDYSSCPPYPAIRLQCVHCKHFCHLTNSLSSLISLPPCNCTSIQVKMLMLSNQDLTAARAAGSHPQCQSPFLNASANGPFIDSCSPSDVFATRQRRFVCVCRSRCPC